MALAAIKPQPAVVEWSETRRLDKLARRKKEVTIIRNDRNAPEHRGVLTGVDITGPETRTIHLETPDGPVHAGITTGRYRLVA